MSGGQLEFTAEEFDKAAQMCEAFGVPAGAKMFTLKAEKKRRLDAIDNEFDECCQAAKKAVTYDALSASAWRHGAAASTADRMDHLVRTIVRAAFSEHVKQEKVKAEADPGDTWGDIKDVPMGTKVRTRNGGELWRVEGGGVFDKTAGVAPGFLDEDRLDHYDYTPFRRVT